MLQTDEPLQGKNDQKELTKTSSLKRSDKK